MSETTIAVAVDGSEANRSALGWAVMHAGRTGADLRVTTIAEPYQVVGTYVPQEQPQQYVQPVADNAVKIASQTLPEDKINATVETGHPVPVLQQVAEQVDTLVIGKRGHGAIGRLLLGSTSIAVAGRAASPVVVVPDGWIADDHLTGPVVFGADVSKQHQPGLRFAFRVARDRGVPLKIVQVWEAHPAMTLESAVYVEMRAEWERVATTELNTALEAVGAEFSDVPVEKIQRNGRAAHELLAVAEDAQLLVLGRDPKERLSGFALGSVARAVLHDSEIPVAIIPAS